MSGIEWTVHLANKKSSWYDFITSRGEFGYASDHPLRNASIKDPAKRLALIIDPGPRTLSGPNQNDAFSRYSPTPYSMTFPPLDTKPYQIDSIGNVITDSESRLIVLGGYGCSGTDTEFPEITDYANNDGWWDDTSDGPVNAKLSFNDGSIVDVVSAWAMVGPPAYAPQILNLVTLYDTMFDIAVRCMGIRKDMYDGWLWNAEYRPCFETEILPILERGNNYPWVVAIPPKPHKFDMGLLGDTDPKYDSLRQYYYDKLRAPDMENIMQSGRSGHTMMPYLAGDDALTDNLSSSRYLTFTRTQYFVLEQWAKGKFVNCPAAAPVHSGEALTQAALENCVGGAFSPGIEMTWISRNTGIYAEPFRLKAKKQVPYPLSLDMNLAEGLEPGDACKFMAVPWQADFNECAAQPVVDRIVWWWPAQRPLWVYVPHPEEKWKQVPWVGTDYDQNAADFIQFADDITMVSEWMKLGFIINSESTEPGTPEFIEVERLKERLPSPQ